MRASDFEIRNYDKLDRILSKLCKLVDKGQSSGKDYGMVAAAVLDPKNQIVARLNRPAGDGKRVHAERAAMEAYQAEYGDIPEGSIIITTLSPCSEHLDERHGESCTDLINRSIVKKVYCGYLDPTQDEEQRDFNIIETMDDVIRNKCKEFADTFLDDVEESLMGFLIKPTKAAKASKTSAEEMRRYFEKEKAKEPPKYDTDTKQKPQPVFTRHDENFADGRHPEDKGDSARYGIPKHASISTLRKIAHQGGRKGQLAHWQANMKSGKKK
jgi:pyrimidine deaminase RibD-like protein